MLPGLASEQVYHNSTAHLQAPNVTWGILIKSLVTGIIPGLRYS
jgi:hypothetical protein